eukprot:1692694-Pyramimonas_sp.AAC.1
MAVLTRLNAQAAQRRMLIFSTYHGFAIQLRMDADRCLVLLMSKAVFQMFLPLRGSGLEGCLRNRPCHRRPNVTT